jgi:cell division protein FtsL
VAPARSRGRTEKVLARVSTTRFLLYVLLFCVASLTYVNHVYATQELLTNLERVRRENQQLHLRLNRLKATFDAATAPSLVIPRARALGLEQATGYGPEIQLPAP